jgi:ABC-type branched-subunit amino acid transport system substrate-binding protein
MLQIFKKSRRGTVVLAVLAACASALAISGAAASAGAKGPLVIMVAAGNNNPVLNQPETWAGAEAGVLRANSQSPVGIHGQKIKIETCNTGGADVNANTACARQAIADHVVAAVWFDTFTSDAEQLLNSAHIPLLGTGSTTDEQTLPNSFPLGGGSGVNFGGVALYFRYVLHKTNVAFATAQTDPAYAIEKLSQTVIQRLGDTFAGAVYYPLTTQDFTPYAQQLKNTGADALVLAVSSTRLLALVQALHQVGFNGPIGACTQCITLTAAQQNASVVNGLYLSGNYPGATANVPGMVKFRADAALAQKRGVPYATQEDDNMVQAWLAILALAEVGNQYIKKGTPVTNTTMLAALAQAKNIDLEGLGKWNPGLPGLTQGANAPKITYGLQWIQQIQPDGSLKLQTPKPLDVLKAGKMTSST